MEAQETGALGMLFSENLMRARKMKGMTQKQFADSVGVHVQSVGNWENGKADPSFKQIATIAKALGIEPWLLFAPPGVKDPKAPPTLTEALFVLANHHREEMLKVLQMSPSFFARGQNENSHPASKQSSQAG